MLAELKLLRLTCVKQAEKDGDEMYVHFSALRPGVKTPMTERLPANMEHWHMQAGESVTPDHLFLIDNIEQGLKMTLTIHEMDVVHLLKNSLSIVGRWVDDSVGQVTVEITPDGGHRFVAGKHTVHDYALDKADDGVLHFKLTGNKSEYLLDLGLHIAGKARG
jgi:hypothetical protein